MTVAYRVLGCLLRLARFPRAALFWRRVMATTPKPKKPDGRPLTPAQITEACRLYALGEVSMEDLAKRYRKNRRTFARPFFQAIKEASQVVQIGQGIMNDAAEDIERTKNGRPLAELDKTLTELQEALGDENEGSWRMGVSR